MIPRQNVLYCFSRGLLGILIALLMLFCGDHIFLLGYTGCLLMSAVGAFITWSAYFSTKQRDRTLEITYFLVAILYMAMAIYLFYRRDALVYYSSEILAIGCIIACIPFGITMTVTYLKNSLHRLYPMISYIVPYLIVALCLFSLIFRPGGFFINKCYMITVTFLFGILTISSTLPVYIFARAHSSRGRRRGGRHGSRHGSGHGSGHFNDHEGLGGDGHVLPDISGHIVLK